MNGRKLLYRLYHLLWQSIDLLLPPTCGGCDGLGYRWCPNCSGGVPRLHSPICETCGVPVASGATRCQNCSDSPPLFRQLRSWSAFEAPIRPVLHKLKYRRNLGLSEALVPQLKAYVDELKWRVDLVAPVPLGKQRYRQRGYNQAGLISWPLALALGICHSARALFRSRETPSQVGLTKAERLDNVRGAFLARPGLVRNRAVMLVDDVATTGATMSSCAEALYAAGARDVFALTVARAVRDPSGN